MLAVDPESPLASPSLQHFANPAGTLLHRPAQSQTQSQSQTTHKPGLTHADHSLQHFLLLPYPTILTHKSALSTSLAPQIDTLVNRAEALLSSESLRVKNLEDRLNILHSARLPHIEPVRPAHPRTFAREAREADGAGEEAAGGSRLDGLEVKDLNPAQRRKVAMLRGKRERLEKERRALQGAE